MSRTSIMVLVAIAVALGGLSTLRAQEALGDLERQLELPLAPPVLDGPHVAENGYLGMSINVPEADAATVYIESVVPGGPAAQAGLAANDVIVTVNGRAVRGLEELDPLLRQPPGTKLVFQVRREGVLQSVTVTLTAREAMPAPPVPRESREPVVDELPPPPSAGMSPPPGVETPPSSTSELVRPSLGITVADVGALSDSDRRRYAISVNAGAVIRGIREGSPAALAGLPQGGVIVDVDGHRIDAAQDLVELVSIFTPGQEIEITYWDGDRKGHKRMRVGSVRVMAAPSAPVAVPDTRLPDDSQPRGRRREGDRPILNALERLLDNVVPPPAAAPAESGGAPLPTPPLTDDEPFSPAPDRPLVIPPPPAPMPGLAESPDLETEPPPFEPNAEVDELQQLRRQIEQLQKQLETVMRRLEELEQKAP